LTVFIVSLAELAIGEKGDIVGFTDEKLSLKLLEMGCLPGSEIMMTHQAPLGDPIAIEQGYRVIPCRCERRGGGLTILINKK
jgi:ferrous iron transport protein A